MLVLLERRGGAVSKDDFRPKGKLRRGWNGGKNQTVSVTTLSGEKLPTGSIKGDNIAKVRAASAPKAPPRLPVHSPKPPTVTKLPSKMGWKGKAGVAGIAALLAGTAYRAGRGNRQIDAASFPQVCNLHEGLLDSIRKFLSDRKTSKWSKDVMKWRHNPPSTYGPKGGKWTNPPKHPSRVDKKA